MAETNATTVRLTAADQRNIRKIIRNGYSSTASGAIRAALAILAQRVTRDQN